MIKYKTSKYNIRVNFLNKDVIFNTITKCTIEQSNDAFYFLNNQTEEIPEKHIEVLLKNGFIVDAGQNETELALKHREKCISQREELKLMILTTFNCNFACPYCIQRREDKSFNLPDKAIVRIENFIKRKYEEHPYKRLHLSLFGGEPLLNLDASEKLIKTFSSFAKEKGINFDIFITTNGSVVSTRLIKILSDYKVVFQITIDGPQRIHDKSRIYKNGRGSFDVVMKNIKKIHDELPNSLLHLRTNFNNDSIEDALELLEYYDFLDRKRVNVSLHPIFQCKHDIDLVPLYKVAAIFNRKGFEVSSPLISPLQNCFLSFDNSYLINYDGKSVLKCSARPSEDLPIAELNDDGTLQYKVPEKETHCELFEGCKECKIMPICLGVCYGNKTIGATRCHLSVSPEDAIKFLLKQLTVRQWRTSCENKEC